MDEHLPRKLVAILYADVAGYSRLTGEDEDATHRTLSEYLDLIASTIESHRGQVMHYAGDAALAKFDAVVDAMSAAVAIQNELKTRNEDMADERKVQFRIGVNSGDVIEDRGDIYGDGVNVAARLETLAEPGGICISESIRTAIGKKLALDYEDMGEQKVKNIEEPVRAYRVLRGRLRTERPAPHDEGAKKSGDQLDLTAPEAQQEIRFCTASDGVSLAYATVGKGPPLVKAANWMNHLEFDWQSPVWRHVFKGLSKDHLLVRYDERGNGLSDWKVEDISFEAFVRDLEAVVEATGLERFALLGISQGCAVSVAYAVRHPQRVTHLVLLGGFAQGIYKQPGEAQREKGAAFATMIRQGWGKENPAVRQMFTSLFIPEATEEQMQWFNDLERITTSPENAARIVEATLEIDVTSFLPQVAVPTLVLHAREDAVASFKGGRALAAGIPGARFVSLESQNHLLLEDEPAWSRFLTEVRRFLNSPT